MHVRLRTTLNQPCYWFCVVCILQVSCCRDIFGSPVVGCFDSITLLDSHLYRLQEMRTCNVDEWEEERILFSHIGRTLKVARMDAAREYEFVASAGVAMAPPTPCFGRASIAAG